MKPLTKEDKQRLRKDVKSYHVAAVLDKAASARALAPLPTSVEVVGSEAAAMSP